MKTLNERFATLRQPLGLLFLLVGGCACFAALAVVLLPALPSGVQRSTVGFLAGVPGIYRSLDITAAEPVPSGSLRLELSERAVARFPASEEAWSSGGFELKGASLPLVLAGWGALLGLLLHLLWFVDSSRQVLGLALLLGVVSGLLVSHSLPMVPRYWASFWLRGAGGLPGLEERVGSPVGIENQPSSAYLVSSGGRVADYPPTPPPWESESKVEINGRGRAWFAGYGVLVWLGLMLVAAAAKASRWRVRVLVGALGLGLGCWLLVPFLPSATSEALIDLLAGATAGVELQLPGLLSFAETTRLGVGVGFGLLLLLILVWLAVLAPAGLLGGATAAWRSRSSRRSTDARLEEEQAAPEPIPVEGDENPGWLSKHEQRLAGDVPPDEPHPADEPS